MTLAPVAGTVGISQGVAPVQCARRCFDYSYVYNFLFLLSNRSRRPSSTRKKAIAELATIIL